MHTLLDFNAVVLYLENTFNHCGPDMSEYTRQLSARDLISGIAHDYIELSYDKIKLQRDEYIRWCREWLEYNPIPEETDDE